MNVDIKIAPLNRMHVTDMYMTFLDAFSDYHVPFRLTKEQFVSKFVEKLKINFPLSAGAFKDDFLVGFIFTSVNKYKGKLTAYNGGTGVRPEFRGRQLTHKMYEFLIPKFKEAHIEQCVLEVLIENDRAMKVYQSLGFYETQYFKCFKLNTTTLLLREPNIDLKVFSVQEPQWELYENFADQIPSFLDSSPMIKENLSNETVVEAHYNDRCIGYAVFQPAFGRISQIGVDPQYRQCGVGSAILRFIHTWSKQKALSVINIERTCDSAINFFKEHGFKNQLNQYEMMLSLV